MTILHAVKIREYLESHETINLWSVPGYIQWTGSLNRDQFLLAQDNRRILRELFGDPSGKFRNEFAYDVWIFDNGFIVFSAKVKGTQIEMPQEGSLLDAQEFSRWLIKKIKKCQNSK